MGIFGHGLEPEHDDAGGSPLKWADRILVGVFAACVLVLLWQIAKQTAEIPSLKEKIHMTDPGPMELKTSYLSGYNDAGHTQPAYEVVTTTRNAPSETVSQWQERHFDAVIARMEIVPPYGD